MLTMDRPEINLAYPIIDEEMLSEAERVLTEEFFLGGDSVSEFEQSFADYVGTEHAVAVDSGTRALEFSLRGLGIGDGDVVVTTPASFIATANAIVHTGATPVFVDVSLDTYTIDISALEQKVEELAKKEIEIDAVMPVHLYGYPVNVNEIRDVVGDTPIVADTCQAHGASLNGQKAGSMADAAGFSFYPSKNMTVAGDGGIITTDDEDVAETAMRLRDVGRGDGEYAHDIIGYTARLPTIAAAIGNVQLNRLDEWNERRREIAAQYTERLSSVGDLTLPPDPGTDRELSWYLYVVRTAHRDELASFLDDRGVETGIQYEHPIHLQPPYRERGWEAGDFPKSEQWGEEVLSLPIHPSLDDRDVSYVIDQISTFFEEKQ